MGYCCMKINKIHTMGHMVNAYKHNYREKPVINADPALEDKNEELVYLDGKTYEQAFRERTESLGYGINKSYRKNGVLAYEVVTSFSREDLKTINLKEWKKDNVEWMREAFNVNKEKYGDNVLSVVYHGDEVGNVHCHAFILPVDERGRLNASYYTGTPLKMAMLQTSYAEKMKTHNLERGIEGSVAHHDSLKKFYGELNKALSYELPEYTKEDTRETYLAKLEEMMQDLKIAHLREQKQKEQELIEAKSLPYEDATHYKRETQRISLELRTQIKRAEKAEREIEELEHEFGSMKEIKDKLKTIQYLSEGLKDEENVDKANYLAAEINRIVMERRKARKKEQEKEAKRLKVIFEKDKQK